jgi:surface antigen
VSPVLLLTISGATKKQIYFVLVTLAVILALPVMAVFALGQNTLSFLAQSLTLDAFNSISGTTQGLYQGPLVAADTYAWGNCTYWVFLLRQKVGDPIPTTWGNAATWALNARLGGYSVNQTPSVGAIMQIATVDNGLGHVAYVESVNSATGAWTISEMNVKGLDIVDTQTYPASAALGFSFIHDKVTTP